MNRQSADPAQLQLSIIDLWAKQWFLLTAGDFESGDYNPMTVAWGSIGVMWGKPFAQVVVRPSRHTHDFMERHDTFTLCAFPAEQKKALTLCGTKSGRDLDKVAASGLTPIASSSIAAPGFDEAELIIECKRIYTDTMKPEQFEADFIEPEYKGSDYHTITFGQIMAVSATPDYLV